QRWEQLDTRLGEGEYTYLPQGNDRYMLVVKRSTLEVLKTDIDIMREEKEGRSLYRSSSAIHECLQKEFNLEPGHYKRTVFFPDEIKELKRQLKIQFETDEYRLPMFAVLDHPAFRADPIGYLRPLFEQSDALSQSKKQEDRALWELLNHQ